MIETNFDRLMSRSADLLAELPGSKSHNNSAEAYTDFVSETGRPVPVRHYYKCFMLLVEDPDTFVCEPIIVNIYEPPEGTVLTEPPVGTTVIVHGHSTTSTCFAKDYCHVLGYQGSTNNWKKKWGHIYATSASTPSKKERSSESTSERKTLSFNGFTRSV